jgi:hypothetical protein
MIDDTETPTQWEELQAPQQIAEMSGSELRVLQEANSLVGRQSERVELESRLLEAATRMRHTLAREIIAAHGLEDIGQYAVDPVSGKILQTHQLVEVPPEDDKPVAIGRRRREIVNDPDISNHHDNTPS